MLEGIFYKGSNYVCIIYLLHYILQIMYILQKKKKKNPPGPYCITEHNNAKNKYETIDEYLKKIARNKTFTRQTNYFPDKTF